MESDAQLVRELHAELITRREENERLVKELKQCKAELAAATAAKHAPALRRTLSTPKSAVPLTDEELAAMHATFSLFAGDSGAVKAADLQRLHQALGEPLSDEEAREAVAIMAGGREAADFDAFLNYWASTGPYGDRYPRLLTPASSAAAASPASAAPSGAAAAPVSGGAGSAAAGALVPSPLAVDPETRERKRQWYQARFKFLRAKLGQAAIGRIHTETTGEPHSLEYRVRFFTSGDDGAKVAISPWHDIPYKNANGSYNMLVEIPRYTRRKFEIATGEELNPIKQDTKNGLLREYGWGDMIFNYGCIPQTWEDPKKRHPATGTLGDNDPIDIVDIGSRIWTTGSIVAVKVLGVLAMIDSGETDWKLISINTEDPLAPLLNDLDDLEVHLPGTVESLHRWLRLYKSKDGIINEFGFEGKAQGRKFSEELIEETHEDWRALVEARGGKATVSKE